MSSEAPTLPAIRVLVVIACLAPFAQALALPTPEPPVADFTWSDVLPREPVTFTSTSASPSSTLVLLEWTFEKGERGILPTTGEEVEHVFAAPGHYSVTLRATDAFLATSDVTKVVVVPNTPPIALINATPSPAFRGQEVHFEDVSFDEDGDEIVSSTWAIDGTILHGRDAFHVFSTLGAHLVELRVQDAAGAESVTTMSIRVLNRPPVIAADFTPPEPTVGEMVTFQATGVDPDSSGPVTFEWGFSDGMSARGGTLARTFAAGDHSVTVRGRDADGGLSAPWTARIVVR